MIMLDEIHTVTATVDGETVASFEARLNDSDTVGGMRDRLVQALDGDTAEVAAAFDAAFGRCEATPGDAAVGYAHAGSYAIEVRRDIGE
jgi:hypothetical protein